MSQSNKRSEVDWSKVRVGNVYIDTLPPEERKKYEAFLTPEKRAELKRSAELEDQDQEWVRAEQDRFDEEAMGKGCTPHRARAILRRLAWRQGLSNDEMLARSGLDTAALASMKDRDAKPTIETMEAYAKALGKKLLIVLADAEGSGDEPETP